LRKRPGNFINMEMDVELLKSSKWQSRWQYLARRFPEAFGKVLAGVEQALPREISANERKIALLAQVLVLALWIIDYSVDIHFHFAILYFIPITYAARAGGVTAGFITSATCTAAWFLAEVLSGEDYGGGWMPYYKSLCRLVGFSAISFLLARGKELNEQLTEKAWGLLQEVERRKRTEKIYADEKEILERIACDQRVPDILEALTRKIEEWHQGLVCAVFQFDAEKERFICAIAHSFPAELHKEFIKKPLNQLFTGSGPIMTDGGKQDLDLVKAAEWSPLRNIVGKFGLTPECSKAVMSASGDLVGILCLFSVEEESAVLDVPLFEKARDIAAIAIERARMNQELRNLSELIIEAQEAERRRIARELHDSVNQMLSSVIFRFGMIEAQIVGSSPDLKDEMAQAKSLLTRGLEEIHRISDALRPSELDALGLVPSIRSLCEEFETKAKLELKFEGKLGLKRLDDNLELTVYRIIQEALTNIEKHAGATRATVYLGSDGKDLQLTIRDNGKGLESTSIRLKSSKKTGMGLLNMRERTAHLGGVFSIQSKEGEGTTICVRIPLEANALREEKEL
jgi:signal transduction histidine kinase